MTQQKKEVKILTTASLSFNDQPTRLTFEGPFPGAFPFMLKIYGKLFHAAILKAKELNMPFDYITGGPKNKENIGIEIHLNKHITEGTENEFLDKLEEFAEIQAETRNKAGENKCVYNVARYQLDLCSSERLSIIMNHCFKLITEFNLTTSSSINSTF